MTLPSSAIIIIIVIAFAFYLIYSQSKQTPQIVQTSCPQCRNGQHNPQQHNMQYGADTVPMRDAGAAQGQYPGVAQGQYPGIAQGQYPGVAQGQYPGYGDFAGMNLPGMAGAGAMGAMGMTGRNPMMMPPARPATPQITNVNIDTNEDPYSDAIKRQDTYSIYDPLTYPQLRLPREVLERYNEYYNLTGTYPPFNQATQPFLFDNPILNGVLIKQVEPNEPFNDNVPNSVPLFRVKSVKNSNRYFYYVIDQRYLSKIEPKIPLDHVKVNGVRYSNGDETGLPELFDGDIIDCISVYPGARFRLTLYKTFHFP